MAPAVSASANGPSCLVVRLVMVVVECVGPVTAADPPTGLPGPGAPARPRPRFPVDPVRHRQTVDRFLAAAAGGRLTDLLAVLDPEVVLTSDGGDRITRIDIIMAPRKLPGAGV